MNFLIEHIEGLFVPIGTKNPKFGYTTGFGPDFARIALANCIEKNKCIIRKALADDALIIEGKVNLSDANLDFETYLVYSPERRWIFVYENDFDIGILFSEDHPSRLNLGVDTSAADNYFLSSCNDRIKNTPLHFNVKTLQRWIDLRNDS